MMSRRSRRSFRSVINYLDDFLIIGKTYEECQQGLITPQAAQAHCVRSYYFFKNLKK